MSNKWYLIFLSIILFYKLFNLIPQYQCQYVDKHYAEKLKEFFFIYLLQNSSQQHSPFCLKTSEKEASSFGTSLKKVLKCDKCDYTTLYLTNLKRHRNAHLGTYFPCNLCQKVLKDKYELNSHLKGHAGLLTCNTCGRHYTSVSGLNCHKRTYKHV